MRLSKLQARRLRALDVMLEAERSTIAPGSPMLLPLDRVDLDALRKAIRIVQSVYVLTGPIPAGQSR
jgi:hypothetical protein